MPTVSAAGQDCRNVTVLGTPVQVDGDGPEVLVMLHGWPDTRCLWSAQVAYLLDTFPGRYACVRFTWPGFDVESPAAPRSLRQLVDLVHAVAQAFSPGRPVTLLMHDWGCVFGYEFVALHPERVSRIVAVDIGDHNSRRLLRSMTIRAKLLVAAYQGWLVAAWGIGRHVHAALGDRMSRWIARVLGAPAASARIGWKQNYPYVMQWTSAWGGLRGTARVAPACPMLYLYGRRKPFQFQSAAWLERLTRQPGCEVHAFDTGHWLMLEQPAEFHACVGDWLARTPLRA